MCRNLDNFKPNIIMQINSSGRFAPLEDLTRQEAEDAQTRVFEGAGTSFLPVVDLLQVERIRIGSMELPLSEKRHYPIDNQLHTQEVEEPLISLQTRSDGTPVLIRSTLSNDGIWPKGVSIFITGQWASVPATIDASGAVTPAAAETDTAVREKVARETRDASALSVPGQAPVIIDPVAALHNPHDPGSVVPDVVTPQAGALQTVTPVPVVIVETPKDGTDTHDLNLPDDVLEKVAGMGSAEDALKATNEQFNALGISGPMITRVRNALKKIADG